MDHTSRHLRWVPAWALACLALASVSPAPADEPPPAGPPVPSDDTSADPGELGVDLVERPEAVALLCSPEVCIHGGGEGTVDASGEAFEAARRALAALDVHGLPSPAPDGGAGGSFALDVYLLPAKEGAAAYPDLPAPGHFARASAFALVGLEQGPRCALSHAVTRAVVQAALLSLDRWLHDGVLAMVSSYLAGQLSPCPAVELAAIDSAQRMPHRTLTNWPRDAPSGALLFPWFLDLTYGAEASLPTALLAISAQPRAADPLWRRNEPDLFDALREVLRPRGSSLSELLLDYAIARAFLGSRSDGVHFPASAWLGHAGRVRFEWALDYDSLPRRVAPLSPIEPTGSTYLFVDLRNQGPKTGVRFIAEWEVAHVFSWAIVEVDAAGRALASHEAGGIFGHHSVDVSLVDIGKAAGLLVVGSHLGSDDRSRPFDPDRGAPAAASYEATFHRL